jgi:hypothetical protein
MSDHRTTDAEILLCWLLFLNLTIQWKFMEIHKYIVYLPNIALNIESYDNSERCLNKDGTSK